MFLKHCWHFLGCFLVLIRYVCDSAFRPECTRSRFNGPPRPRPGQWDQGPHNEPLPQERPRQRSRYRGQRLHNARERCVPHLLSDQNYATFLYRDKLISVLACIRARTQLWNNSISPRRSAAEMQQCRATASLRQLRVCRRASDSKRETEVNVACLYHVLAAINLREV